ncbi:LamG domain-containing protein [Microbacterium allomyrinae]|uniref:Uncharacterized protein n=1 Tax=Microbacterium allomyrinae TaxID=2830666 RepID=A0A9X1LVM1_9MICO|nr:LamG domain-containing protein [Microbacterium allomyrinae]MCC2032483.1 hypothetical protein [Microbacterium allomyrinae]
MQQMSRPRIVSEPTQPTYVRIDRVPALGTAGLTVSLVLSARHPGDASRGAQVALACAEHAAGWSLGLDPSGRVSLVVGTRHGPVAVTSANRLDADRRYRVVARIPGGPGRLEVSVQPASGPAGTEVDTAGVRVGVPGIASRGPLLWGCRSLFDGVRPELPFDGVVGDVRLAPGDESPNVTGSNVAADAEAMSWVQEVVVGFPV